MPGELPYALLHFFTREERIVFCMIVLLELGSYLPLKVRILFCIVTMKEVIQKYVSCLLKVSTMSSRGLQAVEDGLLFDLPCIQLVNKTPWVFTVKFTEITPLGQFVLFDLVFIMSLKVQIDLFLVGS